MLNSTRRAISYPNPDRSDRPDIPAHILNLVNALEVDVVYAQLTNANRLIRAHMAGTIVWTTDTNHLWYDDGVAWWQIDTNASLINLSGTYAARPAATTVPAGTRYFATDTLGTWRSDAATWTLEEQGVPLVTTGAFAAAPFSTPYDGQRVALQVDATNGVIWHFRYNAASGSAYKWEFLGGPPLSSVVETSEAGGNNQDTTYKDLATVGPQVTIPRQGDYDATWEAGGAIGVVTSNGAALNTYVGITIGGVAQGDATATRWQNSAGAGAYSPGGPHRRRYLAIATGAVLKMQYKVDTSAFPANNTGQTVDRRGLQVTPVRIG